ncbi:WS/DGAT domain-containing protein [Mycobacterium sp. NPDC048908]|uniref:WS/DGAT domain-containing protein n=1 Tax=Mycobacterium sp. NPDC048908 TaxID=3364292 RepID=UPI0037132BF0
MMVRRLSAVDAQTYWMSAKIPNDQFLLYAFAGVPANLGQAVDGILRRARTAAELRMRIEDRGRLTYPAWVRSDIDADHIVVHGQPGGWARCLAAVAGLAEHQLDARRMAWRLHVFTSVADVPGVGVGTVAVLQVAHVLGDGIRSSALAAWLFGRAAEVLAVPAPPPLRGAALPWRAFTAAMAHRRLVRDVEAGLVPPQADSRPALRSNVRPDGVRSIRTVVRNRAALRGPTITVGVLSAVSTALSAHLRELGDDPSALGAEVPMAKAGVRNAHNHFGNVGVGLYPDLAVDARIARILEDMADRRRRAAHPAMLAASRAAASVPAPLLRWGVAQFDPMLRSPTVTGNTVVSSVNRGSADLRFGGLPVALTAGYPGLSPMMGLTHGVHGIGDTIAVSVHAAESAVGDVDAYVERLEAAL